MITSLLSDGVVDTDESERAVAQDPLGEPIDRGYWSSDMVTSVSSPSSDIYLMGRESKADIGDFG